MLFIHIIFVGKGGRVVALKNESDGYVPTGEHKQGAFGVRFCRKKGSLGVDKKKKDGHLIV